MLGSKGGWKLKDHWKSTLWPEERWAGVGVGSALFWQWEEKVMQDRELLAVGEAGKWTGVIVGKKI